MSCGAHSAAKLEGVAKGGSSMNVNQGYGEHMRTNKLALLVITGVALAGAVGASPAVAAGTPTGFIRDGMNMTAAVIADGDISGKMIDASLYNIGLSYGAGTTGTVERSEVLGTNYFSIIVTGEDALNV